MHSLLCCIINYQKTNNWLTTASNSYLFYLSMLSQCWVITTGKGGLILTDGYKHWYTSMGTKDLWHKCNILETHTSHSCDICCSHTVLYILQYITTTICTVTSILVMTLRPCNIKITSNYCFQTRQMYDQQHPKKCINANNLTAITGLMVHASQQH